MPTAPAPEVNVARRDPRIGGAARLALVFFSASLVVFVASGFASGNYYVNDIGRSTCR